MYSCYVCKETLPGMVREFKPLQLVACANCLNISLVRWYEDRRVAEPLPKSAALKDIVPSGSTLDNILSVVPKAITHLPILAEIPQREVKAIHTPDSSLEDVAAIIREDATLSTKILSLSNSALFATVSEIVDLPTACSRLGMRTLSNIANAMATANQYKSKNPVSIGLMQSLWKHSVATAYCAEAIAEHVDLKSVNPTMAYVSGLLHDIGKAVLVDVITTQYPGDAGRLKTSPELIAKAIDPIAPLVGIHVIQHWRLPGELAFIIFFGRHPKSTPHPSCIKLSYCLRLASDMAEVKGYGTAPEGSISLDDHVAAGELKLTSEDIERLMEKLDEQLEPIMNVFGVVQ